MYRRGRRNKLRYRKARFLNRKIEKGWLPPSTQRRYDTHLKLIKIYQDVLPITEIIIEVSNFDIQKIMNPEISGNDYQQGNLYGHQNLKSYIISREHGKCQLCKEKNGRWELHHKDERREGGTDSPENFALLHEKCHKKLHKKGLKFSAPKRFKAETFMSIIQHKFLKDIPNIEITFGYKTFIERNKLGLEKTHFNDAFVIAGGTNRNELHRLKLNKNTEIIEPFN